MALTDVSDVQTRQSPLDTVIAFKGNPGLVEPQLHFLTTQVEHNLQYQHRWTDLKVHSVSPISGDQLSRPLISGLPPRRIYVHPEEQQAILKAEVDKAKKANADSTGDAQDRGLEPVHEWVLPTHVREEWSLSRFGDIFANITAVPPNDNQPDDDAVSSNWNRTKRLLIAITQDDSSIVYYVVHDGIVKPRQN